MLKKQIILFCFVLLLSGCGLVRMQNRKEYMKQITIGLPQDEVESKMGVAYNDYERRMNDIVTKYYVTDVGFTGKNEYAILCFKNRMLLSIGEANCTKSINESILNELAKNDNNIKVKTDDDGKINDEEKNKYLGKLKNNFSFRGIIIGAPLIYQINKCPTIKSGSSSYEYLDYEYKSLCFDGTNFNINAKMLSIRNLPDIGLPGDTTIGLVDGKVEEIVFMSPEKYYDNNIWTTQLSEMITKKYGKPLKVDTSTAQNKLGAQFKKIEIRWRVKNVDLYLTNIFTRVDQGVLLITSDAWDSKLDHDLKAKEKEHINNL